MMCTSTFSDVLFVMLIWLTLIGRIATPETPVYVREPPPTGYRVISTVGTTGLGGGAYGLAVGATTAPEFEM